MTMNYEICAAAAAKFSSKKDFREKSNSEMQWLQRNGLLAVACQHMQPLRRFFTDDDVALIASKYGYRSEFKIGDQSAYNAAINRGIIDRVCAHMSSDRYRTLTNEQIAKIALQFSSRSEFNFSDRGAYQTATKRGILDTVCSHMPDGDRRLSSVELLEIAKQFNTRNDLKLGDFGVYTTIIRRGLIEAACAHMEFGATGFRGDMPAVLYQFRVETLDGAILYKIGITNRKPRQRLITMGLQRGTKAQLVTLIKFDIGRDARIAEKELHSRLSAHRYNGVPIMKNGNTELFTFSDLEFNQI